jgi:hypothetical protein
MTLDSLKEFNLKEAERLNDFHNGLDKDVQFLINNRNKISSYVIGVRYNELDSNGSIGKSFYNGSIDESYVACRCANKFLEESLDI